MTRVHKQPEIRKQELLDIGVQLYFDNTCKGISIQRVVQKANVATGLFYYYFTSKEHFIEEMLNAYIECEISELCNILKDSTKSIKERLDQVLDAYIAYASSMAHEHKHEAFHSEKHHQLHTIWMEKTAEKLTPFIEKGSEEGIFHIQNIKLTTSFLVHALSCVFDDVLSLQQSDYKDMKAIVYHVLGVEK